MSFEKSIDTFAGENGPVLGRLASLSKQLSHATSRQAKAITIDPNDFELQKVLSAVVGHASDHGIPHKTMGVELDEVSVFGNDEGATFAPTVGELLTAPLRVFQPRKKASLRAVISRVNGVVRPGEMVLVLGRPGSGCSTTLKTVAGELDSYVRTEGAVSYDSVPQDEMLKRFKRDIIYNPELDVHFPHLTVDQTLRFAIACRTPSYNIPGYDKQKYIETFRDILCTVYGLSHTLDTKVGDDYVRGVSGGERKRVSIAEVMTTRPAVVCFDNATRGLDASTALEFTEALRTATNMLQISAFVTLYQAAENIYNLFDKVSVMYLGRQVFFGDAQTARAYFERMGYVCPHRQTTAEFLTAVTDPAGRYAKDGARPPATADEFEAYWRSSPEFAALQAEIAQTRATAQPDLTLQRLHQAKSMEAGRGARLGSRYSVSYTTQLMLCTQRGFQRIMGDRVFTLVTIAAAVVQALITGSLYYNIPQDTGGAFSRSGVVFFGLLYFALMSMAEISVSFQKRPILLKQKGYSLYHPSAEVIGYILNDIPVKMVASVLFSLVLYFMADLKQDAGAFFTFVLFVNLGSLAETTLFQTVAALSPNAPAANAVSGVLLLASVVYTSYMVQRPSMHPWFKWISYINPMLYAFEAILSSEFHGRHMACVDLAPSGPGYANAPAGSQACAFTGSVPGQSWVLGDDYVATAFQYSFSHVWRNLGVCVAFIVLFVGVNCVATELMGSGSGSGDHLMFLRGKTRLDAVVAADEESQRPLTADEDAGSPPKPFVGLGSDEVFVWQHVDYHIPIHGGSRQLLRDVQGFCKPGTLTALMGESGAGKTTLLNVLSRRVELGVVSGAMLVDGQPVDQSFERRTGYVQQQDLHIAHLTVRETLVFAARLRRPASVPDAEKLEYVEKIIEILGMQPYADALVGEPGSGLNVEQRKKLSVGVELVAKPALLLFLDEPTSGLDSQSAWAIIQVVKGLAQAGQAVLCTIHQPSATLLEQFDRLLLLQKGGQTVYFGEVGPGSQALIDYFETQGARKCLPHENPAEYVLEVIGAGATAAVDRDWHAVWTGSALFAQTEREVGRLAQLQKPHVTTEPHDSNTYAVAYGEQFRRVLARTALEFWRDTDYVVGKTMLCVVGGLFIGFTFWDLKHSQVGMQNALFAVFLCLIMGAPLSSQIQEKAIASRELFEARESKSNTFHWSVLLLSQVLVEIPYNVVTSTLFFCCYFFALRSVSTAAATAGFFWLCYCVFFQLFYISFSLCLVYMAPNLPTANLLFGFFFSFITAFCNVVQPRYLAPGFWSWMFDLSPYTYFLQSLLGTVLHGRRVRCKPSELAVFAAPAGQTCEEWAGAFVSANGGYLLDDVDGQCGYCSVSVADSYLATRNIYYHQRWRNVGFFCAYVAFNIGALLTLYWFARVRRGSLLALFRRRR